MQYLDGPALSAVEAFPEYLASLLVRDIGESAWVIEQCGL
jgi:hypothetical protein